MQKSLINMERAHAFYAGGLGVIMVLSLLLSNVPELSLSQYFQIPFKRQISAVLFFVGAMLGAWAIQLHMARAKSPWKIPQSKVTIPYVGFLVCSVLALLISH